MNPSLFMTQRHVRWDQSLRDTGNHPRDTGHYPDVMLAERVVASLRVVLLPEGCSSCLGVVLLPERSVSCLRGWLLQCGQTSLSQNFVPVSWRCQVPGLGTGQFTLGQYSLILPRCGIAQVRAHEPFGTTMSDSCSAGGSRRVPGKSRCRWLKDWGAPRAR
jgi:hypothetical protein